MGLDAAAILIPGVTGLGAGSRLALRGGESAAAALGRARHAELAKKARAKGWTAETRIEIGKHTIQPDIVTKSGRIIELKPNTPSGRRAGAAQIERYKKLLRKNGRVIYYDP